MPVRWSPGQFSCLWNFLDLFVMVFLKIDFGLLNLVSSEQWTQQIKVKILVMKVESVKVINLCDNVSFYATVAKQNITIFSETPRNTESIFQFFSHLGIAIYRSLQS